MLIRFPLAQRSARKSRPSCPCLSCRLRRRNASVRGILGGPFPRRERVSFLDCASCLSLLKIVSKTAELTRINFNFLSVERDCGLGWSNDHCAMRPDRAWPYRPSTVGIPAQYRQRRRLLSRSSRSCRTLRCVDCLLCLSYFYSLKKRWSLQGLF